MVTNVSTIFDTLFRGRAPGRWHLACSSSNLPARCWKASGLLLDDGWILGHQRTSIWIHDPWIWKRKGGIFWEFESFFCGTNSWCMWLTDTENCRFKLFYGMKQSVILVRKGYGSANFRVLWQGLWGGVELIFKTERSNISRALAPSTKQIKPIYI